MGGNVQLLRRYPLKIFPSVCFAPIYLCQARKAKPFFQNIAHLARDIRAGVLDVVGRFSPTGPASF